MKKNTELKIYIIAILALLTFVSCNDANTKKILVKGKIIDSLTNQSISMAKVTVLCWYDAGWDKTDYESTDLVTKEDGSFEVKFEEGYKITIASISKYHEYKIREIDSIDNAYIKVELKLKRNSLEKDISKINLRKIIVNETSN